MIDSWPQLFSREIFAVRETSTNTHIGVDQWPEIEHISGHENVLAFQSLLVQISESAADSHDAEDLASFLTRPGYHKKIPHLLVFPGQTGESEPKVYRAAVLLFEYRLPLGGNRFGGGTGVFSSLDQTGRRTVFAPAAERPKIATAAAQYLLRTKKASIAYLVFNLGTEEPSCVGQVQSVLSQSRKRPTKLAWGIAEKAIPTYLPLRETFDLTLAMIGQRTRQNYRYSRRKADKDLGCVFFDDAKISLPEILKLNSEAMFAVSPERATERYQEVTNSPSSFLAGIQDRNGCWLALVGGRRRTKEIEIDWQINHEGFATYSLSTVLRSYLIENEITKGTKRLYVEGGTSQHIGNHFLQETMTELIFKQRSWYAQFVSRYMRWLLPDLNPLGNILRNAELPWHSQ